jgi:hypothetical protein
MELIDRDLEQALDDMKHDEIVGALNTIASAVQDNNLDSLVGKLHEQTVVLANIVSSAKERSEPIIIDQNFLHILTQLNESILALKTTKEWKFDVNRDPNGLIKSITAISK